MSILRDRRHLILLAFIVVVRLALVAYVYPDRDKMFNGDSDLYEGLAVSLVEEGRYFFEPYEPRSDLIRTPGYPAFIALNYLLFGTNPLFPILWNMVLVVAVYILLHHLLHRIGGRVTFAPFVILSLDACWMLYSKELLTEPLFTVLLMSSVLLLLRRGGKRHAASSASGGLALGLSALVKPVALYLPICIVPLLLFMRARVGPVAIFALTFLAVTAPWIIRNKIVHDTYTYTSIQSHNLLFAHAAFVYADAAGITHRAAQDSLFAMLERRIPGTHETAPFAIVEAAEEELAAEILRQHPLLYAKAIVRGVAVTLFDPGRLVFTRTFSDGDTRAIGLTNTVAAEGLWRTFRRLLQEDAALVAALLSYLVFLIGVNGLIVLGIAPFFRTSRAGFALVTVVVVYLLVLGGPNGYARFRLYVFPLLLVYANFGWTALRSWLSRRSHERSLARSSSA